MTETTATTEATEMTEATVVGPPSTKAQIIPDDELAPQLLDMFIQNFGDVNFAGCVHQQVFDALARGEIATVDIANYIRNLVTGPMQAALVSIQDAATCRR
ncbi:MAG TPA: hypothetical protein PLV68_05080 [Ilumatobacteraceae bacterium]|nr:hypothetical protein [Ilumatobacteraceae bacterium]